MDLYKSARLISANGKLQKNKGIMLLGTAAATIQFKGMSGADWVTSTVGVTGNAAAPVTIIPVSVYGITLGGGSVFELN